MLLRISKCSESLNLGSGCAQIHWSVLRIEGNHCRSTRKCREIISSFCHSSKGTKGLCRNLLQLQYPSLRWRFSVMQLLRNQFNNYFCILIWISLSTHHHSWRRPNWLPLQNRRLIGIGKCLSIPCDVYLLKSVYNRAEQNFSHLVYGLL